VQAPPLKIIPVGVINWNLLGLSCKSPRSKLFLLESEIVYGRGEFIRALVQAPPLKIIPVGVRNWNLLGLSCKPPPLKIIPVGVRNWNLLGLSCKSPMTQRLIMVKSGKSPVTQRMIMVKMRKSAEGKSTDSKVHSSNLQTDSENDYGQM